MTTRKPKTGEPRRTRQPLNIDLLPQTARNAIQALYDLGRTWKEIEEISALPFGAKWATGENGFVDWEKLEIRVLEKFPQMRIPKSNLQRWYDLRVSQVMAETMARSAQARELAQAFAKSMVRDGDQAVINAARDIFMSIIAEDGSTRVRAKAAKELVNLGFLMQGQRANDIKARKIGVDERRIKLLEEREEAARKRVDEATQTAAKKGKGQFSLDDINLLRERTFGLPPLSKPKAAA